MLITKVLITVAESIMLEKTKDFAVKVNGKAVASRMWTPYQVDLTDYITVGENELEITILNNLRNMMGPHHMEVGESILVAPGSFFKESNIFKHKPGIGESCHDTLPGWSDGYSLVHFGLVE